MYNKTLLQLAGLMLLLSFSVHAALVQRIPEGPTGLGLCTNGLDDDHDGLIDNCTGSAAWSSCTGGYCAEIENGVYVTPAVEVADATFSDSAYVHIPLGTDPFQSQVVLCNTGGTTFANGTYYLHLLAAVPSTGRPWVWVSLDTPFTPPLPPDNAKAMLFFNGLPQLTPTWDFVNSVDSAANFATFTVGTDPKTFALNGSHCLYLMPSPEIRLDAAYLTTNLSQEPQKAGGGGGTVDYEIKEVGANTITVNGACAESAWGNATVLTFAGGGTSTNGITWKMLWDDTTTDKLYGCVTITDTDLRATTTATDDGAIFSDDGIEFLHSHDTVGNLDASTFKTVVNIAATQAHLDRNYPAGVADNAHTANVTKGKTLTGDLDSTADDTSYVIEFGMDLGFNAALDQLGLGNFRINDRDATFTFKDAFGTGDLNDFAIWGRLKYSSVTVPAGPADTTAPTFPSSPDCTESGIGQTGATISCSVAETETTPVTCRVRYDTDNDAAISGGDAVTTSSVTASGGSSPYTCTIALTGLTAGTTYYYVVDATDGVANTGTSAEDNFTTTAAGSAFYVSPTGSGSTCSTGSPCALSRINASSEPRPSPGETWLVKNGTYTASSTGGISVNCSSNSVNGTPTQPVTIRAENERQALLQDTNASLVSVIDIRNCSYWVLEGLRVETADVVTSGERHILQSYTSDHLTIRRMLMRKTNRQVNAHILYLDGVTNSLIEENELYEFHRHAILLRNLSAASNVVRRNYCHSRSYSDLSFPTNDTGRGDSCIIAYPSASNIIENNIAENVHVGYWVISAGTSASNLQYFGNIANGVIFGTFLTSQDPFSGFYVTNLSHTNFLAVSTSRGYGSYGINNSCTNCTFQTNSLRGLELSRSSSHPATGSSSFFCTNCLALSSSQEGYYLFDHSSVIVNFSNSFGNGTAYSPSETITDNVGQVRNSLTTNPSLGSCKVLIPAGTPMKGVGLSGADIGANVIFKYANGVLTSNPLWDAANSYRFTGCGATVAGINDIANTSCLSVHTRLDVGAAEGCTLPY